MSLVSVIAVSHNSQGYIEACLDSILKQDFKDYEIIVVDNASEDKTKAILKNKYPDIRLVENAQNYGYSKALNQGIQETSGEFILCLNDDVRLGSDFLKNIYKAMENKEDVAAVQSKVLTKNGLIDTTGIFLSYLRRFHDIGNGKLNSQKYNQPRYVFGVSDSASLYRREAFEEIRQAREYFDEDFFCIVEDVDLSWRMQNKGWRMLYSPDAICLHAGGISRNKSKIRQYLNMRNRYLMILKNESLLGFMKLPFVFLVYDLWRNLYMAMVNPRFLLKAVYEIAKLSPRMLKKRCA